MRQIRRMTNESGHFFFGYYDVPAFSANGRFHLCHKADFWRRLPTGGDSVEIGLIDIENGKYEAVTTTRAWNFQQGAMLQWNLANEDEIIYNDFFSGQFLGIVLNLRTGEKRFFDMPFASVSRDGKYALSLNFPRIYDFRKGYGYANIPDKHVHNCLPEDDGIFLVDLYSGATRLILSYPQIWELTGGSSFFGRELKLSVNHITFNLTGDRFVFLARCFPEPEAMWLTATVTAGLDGGNANVMQAYGFGSHYFWKSEDELMIYGDMNNEGLHIIKDGTNEITTLNRNFFTFDGHCSYSPDGRQLLYDTYPNKDGVRTLYLYDTITDIPEIVGEFYAYPELDWDIRCDLHPRFNRNGNMVSFDSVHEGMRSIYVFDV